MRRLQVGTSTAQPTWLGCASRRSARGLSWAPFVLGGGPLTGWLAGWESGCNPHLPCTQATRNGAAPYLSLEDREALGVTRGAGSPRAASAAHPGGGLKFAAYERAAPPVPKPLAAAAADPFAGAAPAVRLGGVCGSAALHVQAYRGVRLRWWCKHRGSCWLVLVAWCRLAKRSLPVPSEHPCLLPPAASAASDDLTGLGQLNLGGPPAPAASSAQPAGGYSAPAAPAYAPAPPAQPAGPQLVINKPRKWGAPQFEAPARPAAAAAGPSSSAAAAPGGAAGWLPSAACTGAVGLVCQPAAGVSKAGLHNQKPIVQS